MRARLAVIIALAACGKTPGMGDDTTGDASAGGTPVFEVVSKDAMLDPGAQVTLCYHFHTSNTTEALVNRWVSDMTPASHHAILFLLPGGSNVPDGTLDMSDCNGGGASPPVWTYATQVEHQETLLPADDGTGKPLAQKIAPNTAAVFQLHYLNATDKPLAAHIDLKAYGLAAGVPFTETAAYVTYQYDIAIGPGKTGVKVSATCPTPPGVKFWTISTHSHKQSAETSITDGSSMLFQSTMWEHPGFTSWMTPDKFYAFGGGKLTWECTYNNNAPPPYCNQGGPASNCSNANTTVYQGPSAVTDEMCMAAGYFFPATGPKFEVAMNGGCYALN